MTNKTRENILVIWRVVLNSFDTISNGLAWQVGRRDKVKLSLDLWPSSNLNHLFLPPLTEILIDRGYTNLCHISKPTNSSIWTQGWLLVEELGLKGEFCDIWKGLLQILFDGHIILIDKDDKLI